MSDFSIGGQDRWSTGAHEIGALEDGATGQVSWSCSCGSKAKRTTGLLTHVIGAVDAGENMSLMFDGPRRD